jgi:hypothetical protein
MKTASAKNKGRRLQNWVKAYLVGLFGLYDDDVKSTSMGVTGEDIHLSPAAREKIPYSIECKSRNKMAIYAMFDQARKNSKTYYPLLIIKEDRNVPLAVVDAEHFFQLVLEAKNAKISSRL